MKKAILYANSVFVDPFFIIYFSLEYILKNLNENSQIINFETHNVLSQMFSWAFLQCGLNYI